MSSAQGTATVVFVHVTLARAASCDACTRPLGRGERARLVVGTHARRRRFRCDACFDAKREPIDALVAGGAETSLATIERPEDGARPLPRLFTTIGVAIKSAWRLVFARARGKKRQAPVVLRHAFEELGPTYIKLGQLIASSQGLFPEEYCKELQKCLDRVKPFGFADVERTLYEELGRDPDTVFADVDPVPLASASIAQVHAAKLRTGEDVVIKVQRPGIGGLVSADLRILRVLARAMELSSRGELANPVGIVEDFEQNLAEELDFRREAANMDEFNRIMALHQQTEVAAPRVHHPLTSKRVLVMERFYGHRVDDVERIRAKDVDGEAKLLTGMRAWFQCMIFHGFFHGDVHAGNLMALDDGRIGFLDFGIVGRFDRARRSQVTDYLLSFASGDFEKLARTMIAMGSVEDSVDVAELARDLQVAYEPMLALGMGNVKYADLIPAIMRVSVKHRMRLPREFVLVTKQMLYFDRYAKVLAPTLNIFRDPRIVTALATDVMMAKMMAV